MHPQNFGHQLRRVVLAACLTLGLSGLAWAGDDSRSMDEQLASAGLSVPQAEAFFERNYSPPWAYNSPDRAIWMASSGL